MAEGKMRGPRGQTWADMVCMRPQTKFLYQAMSSKNLVGLTSIGFDKYATASVCWSEPRERNSKEYELHKNTRYKQCITGEDKTSHKETISQALYVMGVGSTIKEEEGYWQITERPKDGKLIHRGACKLRYAVLTSINVG